MPFKSSFPTPAVAAVVFCLLGGTSPAPAYADLGDQLAKLLAKDGAVGDIFGISVGISGATAIVGAYHDDDNGTFSGSAYLFDISDPADPTQIAKLLPNDGAEDDYFGYSVAISGATAIVGAQWDDDNGTFSGSAYLFDISDPANPTQIAKLLPNDGAEYDIFGISVAINGTTVIVGASGDDDNGQSSGSAYLFDISDPAGATQIAKLLPKDGASLDYFGRAVAISGATAIVGAYGDDDNDNLSGAAYLFDTTTGQQLFKLLPNDGTRGDQFGISVGISGATAIVGARYDDDNGGGSGSAYLFDISDPANPTQIAKVLADDGATVDNFGTSVAINGTTVIVGAVGDDDNGSSSGSAYLFDISDPLNPIQTAKLLPDDGATSDRFGRSVAINGAIALVGAIFHEDNGIGSGSAYLFDAAAPGKCPWDLDGDGSVGAPDLLSLLVSWGPCKGCPADFDVNGDVGASDLLALLVNWGPCP